MTARSLLPRIGLGCDRIGSFNGVRGEAARDLVNFALSSGVRIFDTAAVYGQGDSERILGDTLSHCSDRLMRITKVGQTFNSGQRLLALAKPVAKRLTWFPLISAMARRARGGRLPTLFDAPYLTRQLDCSLANLRVASIDTLLLHSPSRAVIADGQALETLVACKRRGLTQKIGVSCEQVEDALLAVADPRVDAIELRYERNRAFADFMAKAGRRGVDVILRGLNAASADGAPVPEGIAAVVAEASSRWDICAFLIGTTNKRHLADALREISNLR
jgi:aryl-alcohol dehydrogenase-like predicted oxidoreductase